MRRCVESQRAPRRNEQIGARDVASNGRHYRRPDAPETHRSRHGAEQRDQWQCVAHSGIEQGPHKHGDAHASDGEEVIQRTVHVNQAYIKRTES
jgi:hypothetical protein